jgi:hypothetical protein
VKKQRKSFIRKVNPVTDCPAVGVTKPSFPQSGVNDLVFKGFDVLETIVAPGYGDGFVLVVYTLTL